jgi:hypothetical protein
MVRSPDEVRPGDRLLTLVQYGSIVSRVEEEEITPPEPRGPPA